MENSKEYLGILEKINKSFKNIYNSQENSQNVWTIKNGRFVMYDRFQFPPFFELNIDTSYLVTAKGAKTAKGKVYDEFIDSVQKSNICINSESFFQLMKNVDKATSSIDIKEDDILLDGESICVQYKEPKLSFDNREKDLLGDFTLDSQMINEMISFKNKVFNIVLNFDDMMIQLNKRLPNNASYLNFKMANKFLPMFIECTDDKGCEVNISVFGTNNEYIYDVLFYVKQYKINKKGEKIYEPFNYKYGMRVLEL